MPYRQNPCASMYAFGNFWLKVPNRILMPLACPTVVGKWHLYGAHLEFQMLWKFGGEVEKLGRMRFAWENGCAYSYRILNAGIYDPIACSVPSVFQVAKGFSVSAVKSSVRANPIAVSRSNSLRAVTSWIVYFWKLFMQSLLCECEFFSTLSLYRSNLAISDKQYFFPIFGYFLWILLNAISLPVQTVSRTNKLSSETSNWIYHAERRAVVTCV